MSQHHVLIVGAGVTGLLLAQALKQQQVSFTIFERDPDPYHRGKGWGLTVHWALNNLLALLPDHLIERLPETFVNPEAVRNGENGNFIFFNLQTGEALWKVPPSKRVRVSREKLRRLLMEGLDIKVRIDFDSWTPAHGEWNLLTAYWLDSGLIGSHLSHYPQQEK